MQLFHDAFVWYLSDTHTEMIYIHIHTEVIFKQKFMLLIYVFDAIIFISCLSCITCISVPTRNADM